MKYIQKVEFRKIPMGTSMCGLKDPEYRMWVWRDIFPEIEGIHWEDGTDRIGYVELSEVIEFIKKRGKAGWTVTPLNFAMEDLVCGDFSHSSLGQ